MVLQHPPPEPAWLRIGRVIVGIPVFWLRIAAGALALGGEHLGTLIVAGSVINLWNGHPERVYSMLPFAAALLVLRYPAKWAEPRLDHLMQIIWPTATHISELPSASVAPTPNTASLPVAQDEPLSVRVVLNADADHVEERPQVLGR